MEDSSGGWIVREALVAGWARLCCGAQSLIRNRAKVGARHWHGVANSQ